MAVYVLPGSSGWPNVEIVGEAYREAQIIAALGVSPGVDEDVRDEADADLVPEPDNPHDPNAISVRVRGHVVGYLDRATAKEYRNPIHRITASGAVVRTRASIWAVRRESWDWDSERGNVKFHSNVRIALPPADQILPLNVSALNNVAVLPWGNALQVTGEEDHFDHLFNYVPKKGEGYVVLTMSLAVRKLKNGAEKELVSVELDGQTVGSLTPTTSTHFLPTLRHAKDMEKVLGVWARIKGSGLAAELTIYGAKATDLTDEWLGEMPLFPALVAESDSYEISPAYSDQRPNPSVKKRPGATPKANQTTLPSAVQAPMGRISHTHADSAARPFNGRQMEIDGKTIVITDVHRKYSPESHYAAGVSVLVSSIVISMLLGIAIPVLAIVLIPAGVVLGVKGFRSKRRIYKALVIEYQESLGHGN